MKDLPILYKKISATDRARTQNNDPQKEHNLSYIIKTFILKEKNHLLLVVLKMNIFEIFEMSSGHYKSALSH